MRIIHGQTVGTSTQGSTNSTGTLPSRTDSWRSLELKSNGNTEETNNKQRQNEFLQIEKDGTIGYGGGNSE